MRCRNWFFCLLYPFFNFFLPAWRRKRQYPFGLWNKEKDVIRLDSFGPLVNRRGFGWTLTPWILFLSFVSSVTSFVYRPGGLKAWCVWSNPDPFKGLWLWEIIDCRLQSLCVSCHPEIECLQRSRLLFHVTWILCTGSQNRLTWAST